MIRRVENFFEDPIKEREKALSKVYEHAKYSGEGYRVDVPGVSRTEDEYSWFKIEETLGVTFSEKLCFYRRYLSEEWKETYIHSDDGMASFTGIAFLNTPEQCAGGTAIWKHQKYRLQSNPTLGELLSVGINSPEKFFEDVHKDGFEEKNWEMVDFAEMRFNRLILFPSALYHSRYPMRSFGTGLGDSRLIKVFFGKL